ncbi:MAG: PadR family transcriptional regulator [Firmicutes bacterium]|nr:PadR family transcriptional regulator [Bacillota bacterium]
MPKINKTRYAILGVLSLKPGSGYDIKKFCDDSIFYFWNENYGHLYPVLRQLEKDGLVTRSSEQTEGKPPRNVYSITDQGREELHRWLMLPVEPYPFRSELLLKMFFAVNIPRSNLIEKLEQKIQNESSLMRDFAAIEDLIKNRFGGRPEADLWLATLDYGKRMTLAAIEWSEETIGKLREEKTKEGD